MSRNSRFFLFSFCIVAWVSLSACATHQSRMAEPSQLLHDGKFDEAAQKLEPLADKKSDDQLLYLMEYATALQMAGKFKESNEVFLRADRLSDQADYHSVSNIALATLGSEEMIQYKGESYEKLLLNVSLALNFTMLGQRDEALVEARRIDQKVNKIRQEGREDYEQNPFAHYLSGILWEADQKYDDAFISYKRAYEIDATNAQLPEDLIRSSKLSRRDDELKKWKKEFPHIKEDPLWYDKNKGDVVIIVQQGWGPRKGFAPGNRRMPKLYPVPSLTQSVRAQLVQGTEGREVTSGTTRVVYNVERAAIQTLDADYGWMVARKIGAFAAKEVMADQIRQKNQLLGLVAWIGMHASDRADLRQWTTLPQTIQVIRFRVPPGDYDLNLIGLDGGGGLTADHLDKKPLSVKAGRTSFYFWRTIR